MKSMGTAEKHLAVKAVLLLLPTLCTIPGCSEADSAFSGLRERIRREFPVQLPPPPIPENNPMSVEKVALGEALFFDPNLSSCGEIACASCHLPEQGFGDGERVSDGCSGATGRRNSNSIYNTAYLSHLFWDGRVQSLEQQALGPVVDPAEMANTWDNALHYLTTGEHPLTKRRFPASAAFYRKSFDAVFQGEINSTNVAKAIAAYERTVISRDSPFDRWLRGDDSALTAAQKRGALVFFGRGMCSECHPPPNFTDSDFHNVAVPPIRSAAPGLFPQNSKICGGIPDHVDPGRAEIGFLQSSCSDLGKFRTPSLRNVALSAPYMHNGRFSSLEDVVLHYWNVGRGTTTPIIGTLDPEVRLVMLTDAGGHPEDIHILTEFLKGLTGSQLRSPPNGIAPPGG